MSFSLRRLAKDHSSLRQSLPPNFLFPEIDDATSLPDDLTQLIILITGAKDTPYAQGVWRLHLQIPFDYPKNPPKATFKTRIYHPNVDEKTGAICLETLKRDWDPKLTLRDILITISCLLIQPNPDSALNAAAGALIQEDFEAFSKQARLMTAIHASIPRHLKSAVDEAKRRGEEITDVNTQKSRSQLNDMAMQDPNQIYPERLEPESEDEISESEASKENDASLSPSPVVLPAPTLRKTHLGKRALAELPSPIELDDTYQIQQPWNQIMSYSEANVANGRAMGLQNDYEQGPIRKSVKLLQSRPADPPSVTLEEIALYEHDEKQETRQMCQEDEKENFREQSAFKASTIPCATATMRPSLRNVSNVGLARTKAQPRIGIRRL